MILFFTLYLLFLSFSHCISLFIAQSNNSNDNDDNKNNNNEIIILILMIVVGIVS